VVRAAAAAAAVAAGTALGHFEQVFHGSPTDRSGERTGGPHGRAAVWDDARHDQSTDLAFRAGGRHSASHNGDDIDLGGGTRLADAVWLWQRRKFWLFAQ